MARRCFTNPFVQDQEDPEPGSENGPYSPSSGDESKVTTSSGPSPKKRKGVQKRVVTVPISEADGGKSKGPEAYPPSDSWAWRKYGQKPIKGSPYPRGYYRCSSSKGCPARKQVERSRVDPTVLLITYASEHNHSLPTAKHHLHHQSPTSPITAAAGDSTTVKSEAEDPALFTSEPDLHLGGDSSLELPPELDWLAADLALLESPMCSIGFGIYGNDASMVGEYCDMREEDVSLFGDLGELPECSVVFRQSAVVPCVGNAG